MATTELGRFREASPAAARPQERAGSLVRALLAPLASLRLTVGLLGLAVLLVFAGTLAQRYHDISYVLDHVFRSWTSRIEWRWFVVSSWTESPDWALPFLGGKTIGSALALNLLAAHALRFRAHARGARLALGLTLLAAGAGIVYAVVQSGLGETIENSFSAEFANGLWHALRAALGGLALTLAYGLALSYRRMAVSSERWAWWMGAAVAALLFALAGYLFTHPEARLNASGLRILWQLIKATSASAVLWAGCRLVFGRRDGIVLLHSGIALLMLSELYTGQYAVESHIAFVEGQTVSFAEDMRSVELALVDKSDADHDRTIVVPERIVAAAATAHEVLQHEALPASLRIVEYHPSAQVRIRQPGEAKGAADAGLGQLRFLEPTAQSTGVDSEQKFDTPAAYVEVDHGESKNVYLLSPLLSSPESIVLDGKPYELALRFRRIEKPYELTLVDFTKEDYVGTGTPKNFQSVVRLRDPVHHVDNQARIWMNNPLRYAGDTLYQSSFDPNRPTYSDLQVVTNAGWMVPYVACMIVATGMLVHFGAVLWRFVRRREDEALRHAAGVAEGELLTVRRGARWSDWRRTSVWAPTALVALLGFYIAGKAVPPTESAAEMHIREFGKLPVAFGGRTQPLDSFARTTLRIISHGESFDDAEGNEVSAIQWLLDVASASDAWRNHRVFRVENLDVLQSLGLKPRKGFRYSASELIRQSSVAQAEDDGDGKRDEPQKNMQLPEYERQVRLAQQAARQAAEDKSLTLTLTQKKWLELANKVQRVTVLFDAFGSPDFSGATPEEQSQSVQQLINRIERLEAPEMAEFVPRVAMPAAPDKAWETTLKAETLALAARMSPDAASRNMDDAVRLLRTLLLAYRDQDVAQFNGALVEYRELVAQRAAAEAEFERQVDTESGRGRKLAERLDRARIDFEAYYNFLNPVKLCMALYVLAFLLAAGAWLGWFEGLNRAAHGALWLAFALHTLALGCRIYISGRPPVTNLYSSAVFIGWAAVLFALLFEMVYRMGIGNLLAAAIGFPTQLIAYYLAREGDTLGVMQAVLDTNFWLGTHVVCISLGYTTTFLAGTLGVILLVMDRLLGRLSEHQSKQLTRMMYGTICFAIFFSFVGTVLGGLWADDSWGRFWGWDPKENGALMIVLWNAIVLHARWGKLVGPRGLALLTVFGNVVTCWSWFGVNQLGVGLHSYGFTSGVALALSAFVASQLAIMALAALPDRRVRL